MAQSFVRGSIGFDQLLAYFFGFFFCCVLLVFVIFVPEPSALGIFVVRVLLSLAAAGVGAVLPGLLRVEFPGVRAGGALALAAIVFFINPPALVRDPIERRIGEEMNQINGLISAGNIELAQD